MSIAVMNWVWANSPTSGNERLVLLALADACSRDDGTECWPLTAMIARKANISSRSVRRVIADWKPKGMLRCIVAVAGPDRPTPTPSSLALGLSTPPDRMSPPDNLSGGDTGDRPPLTQLRPATPDTAASPDPPENHQRTAPTRGRASAEPASDAAGQALAAQTGSFFAALASRSDWWLLTAAQRRKLGPSVAAALAAGWTPDGLAEFAGSSTAGIRNPSAVLAARLAPDELPRPVRQRLPRPPWCGQCDERTRIVGFHGDAPSPCPRCKPCGKGDNDTRCDRPDLPAPEMRELQRQSLRDGGEHLVAGRA